MAGNGITIKSPVKGVNKNATWVDHDPAFAIDAMNALPFDRLGRNRVNQRPGTSKVFTGQLGSGNPVMALQQTTIPLDPATATANSLVFQDLFPYANGNLGTVGAASWITFKAAQFPGTQSSAGVDGWAVNSNTAVPGDPVNFNQTAVYVGPGASSLDTYTLKANVRWDSNTSTTDNFGIGFVTRVLPSNGFTIAQIITVAMNSNHLVIYQGGSGSGPTTLAKQTLTRAGQVDYALELRVTKSGSTYTYTVLVNGVQQLQATGIAATAAANNGVGISNAGGNTSWDHVTNFQILIKKPASVYRQTNLLAVSGGNIYWGDPSGLAIASGGTGLLSASARPQFAYSAGKGWFVDGSTIQQIDIATGVMDSYAATAGTAPVGCTLAAVYRDRLILAAPYATPHLFYCSRVGVKTDWDYSQLDSAGAFAGSASQAGRIGDPITALIPANDDVLYIGGDHTLHAVRGDPADGGSIDLISDSIGVLGPNAWTKAPDGTIYFVGTGGLFKMVGGMPVNLSESTWNEFFRQIDRSANYIELEWDVDHKGLYIFITPAATGTATHLFWDSRELGFWPVQFPNNYGPFAALVYKGDGATDRVLMVGSRDGYVYGMHDTDKADDTTAISSFVVIGPYSDNDETDSILEWADVILGEPPPALTDSDMNVTVSVQAGPTPERAVGNPLRTIGRVYAGLSRRQTRWRQRLRGTSFVVRLSNSTLNKTWVFERMIAMMLPAGIVRRNR